MLFRSNAISGKPDKVSLFIQASIFDILQEQCIRPTGTSKDCCTLFKAHIGPGVKIKAAGGISSLQDAEDFMALGADRLGTSRIVKLVKGEHAEGY